eukprot:PhM_4_TR15950/c4_g1_i1/m.102807
MCRHIWAITGKPFTNVATQRALTAAHTARGFVSNVWLTQRDMSKFDVFVKSSSSNNNNNNTSEDGVDVASPIEVGPRRVVMFNVEQTTSPERCLLLVPKVEDGEEEKG